MNHKTLLIVIGIIILLGGGGIVAFVMMRPVPAAPGANSAVNQRITTVDPNQPDVLLKSIGVYLEDFDSATGRAGDFVFTRDALEFGRLWMDYGFVIPASKSATRQDKPNPQPTFILPLGTKVRSLIDGVVIGVPELYSHDYSVLVASSPESAWVYETEHVLNPVVKVGDQVTAGQVVAEVSTWMSESNSGLGMYEIGLLHGGNPPEHVCPFQYIDPSVKEDLQATISAFYTAWEEYRQDTTLYDQAAMPVVGCQILDAIEG